MNPDEYCMKEHQHGPGTCWSDSTGGTIQHQYADRVIDGEVLESEELPNGWVIEYYLTGPLNVDTDQNLRYGYLLEKASPDYTHRIVEIQRDGFADIRQAEWHAKRVVMLIDSNVIPEAYEP